MSKSVPAGRRRTGAMVWGGVLAAMLLGIGACELLGWPFLAAPMQRWLGGALDRRVSLAAAPGSPPEARIGLIGAIRIEAPRFEIGAPNWSKAPFFVQAQGVDLRLGWLDLWRASRGAPLRIDGLRAARLDVRLERLADGRASWRFGEPAAADAGRQADMPDFDRLEVEAGSLQVHDDVLKLALDATYSWRDGSRRPQAAAAGTSEATAVPPAAAASASASAASEPAGLQFHAQGSYRDRPLKIDLSSAGVLAGVDAGTALPLILRVSTDRAHLAFDGKVTDVLHLSALEGRVKVEGPSLAALGDPLGLTLPTTGPFELSGALVKRGTSWSAVIDEAAVGSSRLDAAFTFDTGRAVPLLAGRLGGSNLVLLDLGPTIGTTSAEKPGPDDDGVLPDRPLDIPSLRRMDANVIVAIDRVDLGSALLQPLHPLRAHLVLADGVLALRDIDARTSDGRLGGTLRLDGRQKLAVWNADLRWSGVRLEQWIHQARANGAPPYLTGSLSGRAKVEGRGRSTAAILGSLDGGVRMDLAGATISHLVIENAGIDLAQSLGVMIEGDQALPIRCAVADLVASNGVLRPRVMVLDTPDTTLWVDGSLSLASEALDLRILAMPKDFSLLALRSPIRVRGTLSDPKVSIEKQALGARLGAAALLALVNPLAAIIPLMDPGADEQAARVAADCRGLVSRASGKAPPEASNASRQSSPEVARPNRAAKPPAAAAERARRAAPPGTPR